MKLIARRENCRGQSGACETGNNSDITCKVCLIVLNCYSRNEFCPESLHESPNVFTVVEAARVGCPETSFALHVHHIVSNEV